MPDKLRPSEFGGKVQKNRVQPNVTPAGTKGHEPTVSERAMLLYTTGHEDGLHDPDDGEAFAGLLPIDEAIAQMPKQDKFEF